MSASVTPISLLEVSSSNAVSAELLHAITEQQIADWEAEWAPELLKALQRLKRAGVERTHWPQSRHWDWRKKAEALTGLLAYPGFSVIADGVTQGLMFVDTATKRCRVDVQRGKNLVYVEFVENAPWNREELFNPPRYRGVGSVLVRAAIELSLQQGFKGRIGLHSLPQANSFYANTCGMTDLGIDKNHQDLRYFEMTVTQAETFILKGF